MISSVLEYWFGAPITSPEMLGVRIRRWFMGGPAMDAEIIARFGELTTQAKASTPSGRKPRTPASR